MVLNVQGSLSQEFAQVRAEGIQSLRNDVFERRKSTGSGLFAILGSDFDQLFGQIICMRVKTLRNTIWYRHLRLTCVARNHFCCNNVPKASKV